MAEKSKCFLDPWWQERRVSQILQLFNSNFCYDFCYEKCAKLTLYYYLFIVHVNFFHDYVLLWSNYFLAVSITKIFLSFDYAVYHISIIS